MGGGKIFWLLMARFREASEWAPSVSSVPFERRVKTQGTIGVAEKAKTEETGGTRSVCLRAIYVLAHPTTGSCVRQDNFQTMSHAV